MQSGFDMALRDKMIENICNRFSFVRCDVLGQSLCGRDIRCLKIGSDAEPALFVAAFHGMEWLTSLVVLMFVENMCSAIQEHKPFCDVDIKGFLESSGLYVIPCVNPDGVEISIHGAASARNYEDLVLSIVSDIGTDAWQANARGVDLNHNFDAGWAELHKLEEANGITGPAPTRYGGPTPNSEPETNILVSLCERQSFRHAVAFHSQGEEIYWNYGEKTPQIAERMAFVMSRLSGYALSAPEGLAVGGGFKDWFIQNFKRPGFTVEMGKGKNPLPIEDAGKIYEKLENMLVYCSIA